MALASIAETDARVAEVLNDGTISHQSAAADLWQLGISTTESSVRRYRRSNNITLTSAPARAFDPDAATTPAEDSEDSQQQLDDLRRTHLRTLKKLEEQRVKKQELVDAVYQAASEAAAALDLPAVPLPADYRPSKKGPEAEEAALAVVSDWQLAKLTPSYNSEICEERIELYGDKIIELTEIQRADHPVRDIHLWLLGDLIEGELIFPGQHWLIDSSLYMQVCVDGPRILGNLIRKLLLHFDNVYIESVDGNHGRLGGRSSRDYNAESNGDRMLYSITKQLLANETRVHWNLREGGDRERNWYTVGRIGNYSSLLFHGDQIKGHSGFPWYSLQKKVGGWALGAIPEEFQDVDLGHWHQPTRVTLNRVTARCNGSTESHNTYAIEQLAAVGRPSQGLRFVHPVKGRVTGEYVVYLD